MLCFIIYSIHDYIDYRSLRSCTPNCIYIYTTIHINKEFWYAKVHIVSTHLNKKETIQIYKQSKTISTIKT